jgi:hypothetical protein
MAFPQIDTPSGGPLTADDLDEARKHSTGRVFHLHRSVVMMHAGLDYQGRHQTREWVDTVPTDYGALHDSAAVEGGRHADPVDTLESMLRYRRTESAVRWTVALVALVAVAAFASRAIWPL